MKLSGETKLIFAILAVTFGIIVAAVFLLSGNKTQSPNILSESYPREDNYSIGPKDAPVTVVEYSNFECSACKSVEPLIKQMLKTYEGKVLFAYKHFPFPTAEGPNAYIAAEAAEAAGTQGKFWEMHDLLFENQGNLGKENLISLAKKLNLDVEKFTKELNDGTYKPKIEKDLNEVKQLGLNSTPTFFVNGERTNPNSLLEQVKTKIQK